MTTVSSGVEGRGSDGDHADLVVSAGGRPTVGAVLPAVTRRLDSVALVSYAGATWDWYVTHHDTDAAAAAGLPAPIVDGQQLGAMLASHALAALPAGSWPERMDFRFSGMVLAGDTVTVTGTVTAVEDGLVAITQQITTDSGTVAIRDATTTVRLPTEAGIGVEAET